MESKFFKITLEMVEGAANSIYTEQYLISELPHVIKKDVYLEQSNFIYQKLCAMQDCESPMEQMLALQMHDMRITRFRDFNPDVEIIEVENQYLVDSLGYRVDFMIPVWYPQKKSGKQFIIECDGHEFHEKTKEQVRKDKKRDRDLMGEGYIVIRFSGSEIYKSPYKCVKDIIDIIISNSK